MQPVEPTTLEDERPADTPASPTWIIEQAPRTLGSMLSDAPGALRQVTFTCPDHGKQTAQSVKLPSGVWRDPQCPVCERQAQEAERARIEAIEAEQQERRRQEAIKTHGANSGVPIRFRGKDFVAYHPADDEQRKALATCQRYAEQFPVALAGGSCLILCGRPGTGKTHLACAIVSAVIERHASEARYMTFVRAIRSVKQTYAKASETTEQQALDRLCRPALLVLDEVGVQFGSDTERMIGFEIINARYEAMKPTIVVSNLDLPALTECLGERVIDRLRENGGKLMAFNGRSHRLGKLNT